MVTTEIKSVKRDGTGDYTTITLWEAGERTNLVTADKIKVAEIYGRAVNGDVGGIVLQAADWTTDATRYIIIRAAAGHECGGKFNTTKAYMSNAGGGEGWTGIRCFVNHLRLGPGISVYGSQPVRFDNAVGYILVERCAVKSDSIAMTFLNCGTIDIKNCVIHGGAIGINQPYSGPVTCYNSTICITGNNQGCLYLQDNVARHFYSDNNYFYCGTGPVYFISGSTVLHKGANDATSNTEAVTPALRSIPYSAANFINVTGGSENLHLQPTSVLVMKGATISSVTNDIDGTNRVGRVYDICADQQSDVPVCWNYTAKYKNSSRLFKASGCGCFPRNLRVPGNVDTSTGKMVDDGIFIGPDKYKIV